ncbi:MAG TPA: hypothetical protein DCG38_09260 [Eubacteriaceae bacterium]|nr:hypothetical protein [Eubacteriaceae bacterium]
MFDYRYERFYRVFLVSFLIHNLSKNRSGRNILTLEKLELLYLIVNNPILLKKISNAMDLGSVYGYQQDLYENGYQFSDIKNKSDAIIPFLLLTESKKVRLNDEGMIEALELLDFKSSSEFLDKNLSILKKLAALNESKLIRLVSENS